MFVRENYNLAVSCASETVHRTVSEDSHDKILYVACGGKLLFSPTPL